MYSNNTNNLNNNTNKKKFILWTSPPNCGKSTTINLFPDPAFIDEILKNTLNDISSDVRITICNKKNNSQYISYHNKKI